MKSYLQGVYDSIEILWWWMEIFPILVLLINYFRRCKHLTLYINNEEKTKRGIS